MNEKNHFISNLLVHCGKRTGGRTIKLLGFGTRELINLRSLTIRQSGEGSKFLPTQAQEAFARRTRTSKPAKEQPDTI